MSHSLIDVLSVFSKRSELADWLFIGVVLVTAAAAASILKTWRRLRSTGWSRPDLPPRAVFGVDAQARETVLL